MFAVNEVVHNPRRGDAIDGDEFEELILFAHPHHIAAVHIFSLALVNDLRRQPVARAELILDPPVIRKNQPDCFVALTNARFTATDVGDLAAILFPVAAQEILETRTNRLLKVLDLFGRLV